MTQQSPFEQEMLSMMKSLDQKVSSLEGEMKSGFARVDEKVSSLEGEMKSGFARLEDRIDDLRDEGRAESRATRALLDQAFTHISDHMGHDGVDFVPKGRYPRVP